MHKTTRGYILCCFIMLATVFVHLSRPASLQAQGIALDAVSISPGGSVLTESWSHTVTSSGGDRILMVGVAYLGAPSSIQVDSVTYNGTALTQVGIVSQSSNVTSELWRLVNPTTGTHTVQINMNQSIGLRAAAASFLHVDQTTPMGAFVSTTGVSTTPSLNVSSVAEGELVVDVLGVKTSASAAVGAGQTPRWDGAYSSDVRTAGSTEPGPVGGGSVTMSWSLGSGVEWALGAVALKPVNPTAVTLRTLNAIHHSDGVILHWRTGWEVDNVGFQVYREVGGKRVRVTPAWLAGSAFVAGPGTHLTAGNAYTWSDPAGTATDRYWLVDMDLMRGRTWYGPVTPVVMDMPRPTSPPPVFLNQIGRKPTPHTRQPTHVKSTQHRLQLTSAPRVPMPTMSQPWEDPDLTPEAVQRALADSPALTLAVRNVGWYRISQAELHAAGLDPNVDPRHLQLFAQGRPQRIVIEGEADGRLDPGDTLEFYGEGVDTSWTDTQLYWLVVGTQPGERVKRVASQVAPPDPEGFPITLTHQPRTLYLAAIKNGEADNFFGAVVSDQPVEEVLVLHHLNLPSTEDAQLVVTLQGTTPGRHHVTVTLNGHDITTLAFAGQTQAVATVSVPHDWLRDGANRVTLVASGDEPDISVVDTIELTYRHTSQADEHAMHLTVPGQQPLTLTGFAHPTIRVMDVTDPHVVSEIVGTPVPGDAGYHVTVTPPQPGPRTLLIFTSPQTTAPVVVASNAPSSWHAPTQEADLVMLSHAEFLDQLAPLKALREAQGLRVAMLDVQDIYDEFSFGLKTPWAIQAFLQWAVEQWQTPPRFVLLVGDASFDPKDDLGFGMSDWVPTKLVETALLETASDAWFADVNDDGRPELAVGRLPVRTSEEAATVVSKLVAYEEATGAWTQDALFVSDAPEDFDFAAASERIAALLPPAMRVESVSLEQTAVATARETLMTQLDVGQLLVNYLGHGSTEVWASGGLLSREDAQGLSNGERLPLVIAMTCLNGFFHDLYTESLAETLLKAEQGGAVAVWASSGLTSPSGQVVMNQVLVRHLFGEERLTLGEAMMRAKASMIDRDVQRTWMLFGDPTLRLKSVSGEASMAP